jgi:hypothetical protein
LHCEFKSVNACSPDGGCKEGKDLAGMPLPLKVTVDFENTVVASVDDTGYARTDNFDSAANSADQMVVHGIDGAFTCKWPPQCEPSRVDHVCFCR